MMRSKSTNNSNRWPRSELHVADLEEEEQVRVRPQNLFRTQSQPPPAKQDWGSSEIAALLQKIAAESDPHVKKGLSLAYLQAIQRRMIEAVAKESVSPKETMEVLLTGQRLMLEFDCPKEPPPRLQSSGGAGLSQASDSPTTAIYDQKHMTLHIIRSLIFKCELQNRKLERQKFLLSANAGSVQDCNISYQLALKELNEQKVRVDLWRRVALCPGNSIQTTQLQLAQKRQAELQTKTNTRLKALELARAGVDIQVIHLTIDAESHWLQAFVPCSVGGPDSQPFVSAQSMLERTRKTRFGQCGISYELGRGIRYRDG
jgi:hypothetical protein